jgi:hypothetical protein
LIYGSIRHGAARETRQTRGKRGRITSGRITGAVYEAGYKSWCADAGDRLSLEQGGGSHVTRHQRPGRSDPVEFGHVRVMVEFGHPRLVLSLPADMITTSDDWDVTKPDPGSSGR